MGPRPQKAQVTPHAEQQEGHRKNHANPQFAGLFLYFSLTSQFLGINQLFV
jgi:hypothetical protein